LLFCADNRVNPIPNKRHTIINVFVFIAVIFYLILNFHIKFNPYFVTDFAVRPKDCSQRAKIKKIS
jgi:hypothetical protein